MSTVQQEAYVPQHYTYRSSSEIRRLTFAKLGFYIGQLVFGLSLLALFTYVPINKDFVTILPLLIGAILGYCFHHTIMMFLMLISLYIPEFRHISDQMSRYVAIIGLGIWIILVTSNLEGLLLVYGFNIYVSTSVYVNCIKLIWQATLRKLQIPQPHLDADIFQ